MKKKSPWFKVLIATLAAGALDTPIASGTCGAAPTAVDDTVAAFSEPILIDATANDTEPEGELMTLSVAGWTCPGTVTVTDFGLLLYTPAGTLSGPCTISYTVTDETGLAATATVQVTVESRIFSDGLESGDGSAWSSCEPSCP